MKLNKSNIIANVNLIMHRLKVTTFTDYLIESIDCLKSVSLRKETRYILELLCIVLMINYALRTTYITIVVYVSATVVRTRLIKS